MKPIYKRIILKITGEAFALKEGSRVINEPLMHKIADEIESARSLGVQMGIVIGGGNIIRGRDMRSIEKETADEMGMLATAINALALQDILNKKGIETRMQTAIEIKKVAEPYIRRRAIRHLEKNRIVLIACGTGHTRCTTDYAAMLYAYELGANALLKGTKVDGLYTNNPKKKSAKFIPEISYQEALKSNFKDIMDNAALGLVLDNPGKIIIHIFNIFTKGNLEKILLGEKIGSKIY